MSTFKNSATEAEQESQVSFEEPKTVHARAIAAARKAADAVNATLPPESKRGFDVGMAWVVVRPARGPYVAFCKKNNIGHPHHTGGWEIYYSEFSIPTQSLPVHEAAAKAFAAVLHQNGLAAAVGTRLD